MITYKGIKCYPLTYAQRMNWDYEQNFINDPSLGTAGRDVIGGHVRIYGDVDFDIFKKALNIFVKKNDSMRIQYIEKDGEPFQYIEQYEEFEVDSYDFSGEKDPEKQFDYWLEYEFRRGFKLLESKLFYFAIVRIKKDVCGLVAKLHHLNADGWSAALFAMQTCEIYTKLKNGISVDDTVECSYFDYMDEEFKYLNSEKFREEKDFWGKMLSDFPESSYAALTGPMICGKKVFLLNKDLSVRIKEYCSNKRVSLTKFFISVMALYIYRAAGQKDIMLGTYTHNRLGKRKSLVGNCISAIPVRIKIEDNIPFNEFVDDVSTSYTACIKNRKYPLALLKQDMGLAARGYRNFFQTAVNCYIYPDIIVDGFKTDYIAAHSGRAPIAPTLSLQLEVIEQTGKENLLFVFMYRISDYSEEQIEDVYTDLCSFMDRLVEESELGISKLIS
ncbi:MAG: condensation domain-containing protein [Clostridia bacterium]|nr:condensation domain-containing protein [Clostridia bacterium]